MITANPKKVQTLTESLIDEMFRIAGHPVTYQQVLGRKDDWFNEYTMTEDQCEQWMNWGTTQIAKTLRFPKEMARREMAMINLQWGLKIQNEG
jgi:hypothetical protein